MRVAVIGSGVSGIGAAKVLKQCGYDVTVFERSQWIGGVWCVGYPDLHLQVILCSLLPPPHPHARVMPHNIVSRTIPGLLPLIVILQDKKSYNI